MSKSRFFLQFTLMFLSLPQIWCVIGVVALIVASNFLEDSNQAMNVTASAELIQKHVALSGCHKRLLSEHNADRKIVTVGTLYSVGEQCQKLGPDDAVIEYQSLIIHR